MGFHVAVNDLPWFRDYASAKQRYDRTHPVRGTSPELRPLGKRSAKHKTIVERTENGVSYIGCCLYGYPVVKFFSDGRIVLSTCGHATVSTAKFIARVVYHLRECNVFGNKLLAEFSDGRQFLIDDSGLTVEVDGTVTAKPCVVHVLNRQKMKDLRKQYKPFTDYVVHMYKLTSGDVGIAPGPEHRVAFRSLPSTQDLDLWLPWAMAVINVAKMRLGNIGLRHVRETIGDYIKVAHPYLFDRVELPLGEVARDKNFIYMGTNA